jgi:regulator of sigma E protease
MEILSQFGIWGGGWTGWVVPFLFGLSVVVFFHELGHFLVARWCGVKVEAFSVGFGPELIGFYDRHGTRWKLAAIPLGGYVKFLGDDNAASVPDQATIAAMPEDVRRHSFFHQPVGARAAIVAAGPLANFLVAIIIFAGVFMSYGKPSTAARVDAVQPGSAAAAAGFQPGDVVLSIDGRTISRFTEMQQIVRASAGRSLAIVVDRDGQRQTLTAVPDLQETKDPLGNTQRVGLLGITHAGLPQKVDNPLTAVWLGTTETWSLIEQTLSYVGRIIVRREAADQLGGPIRIAQVSGQVAKMGFVPVLSFIAFLSISIGLINLFPIPILDGGHLLFYGIEAIRGRPLSMRVQEVSFRIGLAIVLMLVVFVTYNDILALKLFG